MSAEQKKDKATIIVFSDDLDKGMAAFMIAVGAASSGMDVSLYFTFWGLSLLRSQKKIKLKKSFFDKIVSFILPKGVSDLPMSKMNMMGLGTRMMKNVMKNKKMASLPELMEAGKAFQINYYACDMSMEFMGIKPEELIEGTQYAGVAQYLEAARDAKINLFI